MMMLPRLVYDDFYKFVTSFTLLLFILSVFASYQQIARSRISGVTSKEIEFLVLSFHIFLIFAIISLGFFIWAIKKWRHNQKFYDRKLEAETEYAEITTHLSKAELKKRVESRIKFSKNERKKISKDIREIDPKNLELMKVRYLIEERINELLYLVGVPKKMFRSLGNSMKLLEETGVFDKPTTQLIREVIRVCNKAIHANKISVSEHQYVVNLSERIIFLLEETMSLKSRVKKSLSED